MWFNKKSYYIGTNILEKPMSLSDLLLNQKKNNGIVN